MFFSFFPPEVLSALMHTGPGAGPLTEAAAAWEGLATDLYATAASDQSSVADPTSGWSGPTAMANAAGPFVSWMTATAAAAAQSGAQASAGVAAFETAHALTVPPPVVAANRALFAALLSTNIFGQNSPAIAATEADDLKMWAQDAATMSGYRAAVRTAAVQPASASQAAGTLAGRAKAGRYGAMIGSMPARMFMCIGNSAANSSGLAVGQRQPISGGQAASGRRRERRPAARLGIDRHGPAGPRHQPERALGPASLVDSRRPGNNPRRCYRRSPRPARRCRRPGACRRPRSPSR